MGKPSVGSGLALLPKLEDPRSYPLAEDLSRSCSVVMKGGITSGVVYPRLVCQIATTRKLVDVGGTSAGAIAAAVAAAAEYARQTRASANGQPDVGYPRLAALPNILVEKTKGHTRLYHLFQPQPQTKALYRVLSKWIGHGGTVRKVFASIGPGVLALRPLPTVVGIAITAPVLICALFSSGPGVWLAVILALPAIVIVVIAMILWSLKIRIMVDLRRNHFGLCSGMGSPAALTEWLTAEINRIAGKDPSGEPLTFGELKAAGITLAMLTTDLSSGTQNELPFRSRIWAFHPEEFAELFPAQVVQWLIKQSNALPSNPAFKRFRDEGFYPLPGDTPVIVGVRMSLSFPPLLCTIPLHAIDYTRTIAGPSDGTAGELGDSDPETSDPKAHPIVCHRFSDGGVTSNFPLHFFDAAVPNRPTFGINLVQTDSELSADQADNVWMPIGNRQGILNRPEIIKTTGGFVHALMDTLLNWSDSMQGHLPGYRDRIVAVEHTKTEGGLNLDMDESTILGLADRGQYAGLRAESFDFTNHRWVRFRSLLQAMQEFIEPAEDRLIGPGPEGGPSYDQMINDLPPSPPSYRRPWNDRVRRAISQVNGAFVDLAATYNDLDQQQPPERPVSDGAPSPRPRLQVRPRPLS